MKSTFRTALVLSWLAFAGHSFAGSYSVTPVRIFFEPRDRAVAVTLTNEGDTEVALTADINAWTQDAQGNEQLALTEDLILSPPSLKLAPRSKQVIRLALVTPRDPTQQMTYRLVVRELPEALPPKEGEMQLPIAMVFSMPVFITPPGAKRQIQCSMAVTAAKELEAVCENKGNAYAQLRNLELRRGDTVLATFDGVMYILPGSRKTMPIKVTNGPQPTAGTAELSVMFDDGKPQTFSVTVP